MKFLRSKFFLILVCVAIVLTVIPAVLSAMGRTGVVRNAFMTISYPVRWLFNTTARGISGISDYFTEFDRMKEENEALRKELAEANGRLEAADIALEENEWLRGYFGIADEEVELKLLEASVVGYESGNSQTVYTLDRGSASGVRRNLAVVTSDGVVGCVTEVGLNWCRITCIIEDAMAVGAYLPRTGDHGIVKGDYSRRASGTCLMTGIPENSDISVGDLVRTNGIGSVYPKGISIGRVESVSLDPATRTVNAVIRPSADLSGLKKVMIVLSSEVVEKETETQAETTEDTGDAFWGNF